MHFRMGASIIDVEIVTKTEKLRVVLRTSFAFPRQVFLKYAWRKWWYTLRLFHLLKGGRPSKSMYAQCTHSPAFLWRTLDKTQIIGHGHTVSVGRRREMDWGYMQILYSQLFIQEVLHVCAVAAAEDCLYDLTASYKQFWFTVLLLIKVQNPAHIVQRHSVATGSGIGIKSIREAWHQTPLTQFYHCHPTDSGG